MGNTIVGCRNASYPWNREPNVAKKKKPRVMKSEEEPALPIEVVMEIISWLPLKPLARAQLVCKEWHSLIQERQFLEKHMSRTPNADYWSLGSSRGGSQTVGEQVFYCIQVFDGLVLLRNGTKRKHLVWNPAVRLVLELPASPQDVNSLDAFVFAPASRIYKLVSFYWDKDSSEFRCQVLTLGRSMEWRQLEFPDLAKGNPKRVWMVAEGEGAAHCIIFTKFREKIIAEIVSLDAETESFTVNRRDDVGATKPINCDGKLGFACIDKQELRVVVLQDFKKQRWCRREEVIPLPFLKDEGFKGNNVCAFLIKEGEIWFCLKHEKVLVYTIETGKTRDVVGKCKRGSLWNGLHTYKPTLVTVEGMRADDELKFYRPNFQLD